MTTAATSRFWAKKGFRGPIYCTTATADLLDVVLRDSAHLQEAEAERANRYGYSKHHPARPLYSMEDAEQALALVKAQDYDESFALEDSTRVLFRRAGHILGSATVQCDFATPKPVCLVFSGDLGRWDRPILRDPEMVPGADVLMIESTYGDRFHSSDAEAQLARVLTQTARRGGVVVVPAFAIGRTQELIWTIRKLEAAGQIPSTPVYLDSPMATSVTDIYGRHPEDHDLDMKLLMDDNQGMPGSHRFHIVRTPQESQALNGLQGPMIIIAGSGMATGGRVIHHLKQRLPHDRNTVLLAGFQAAGTRGRLLQDGASEVRIHGESVVVRAAIETIDGLSAHADQKEILRWLGGFKRAPAHTYIVHGEDRAAQALASVIRAQLGWRTTVAVDGSTVPIASTSP